MIVLRIEGIRMRGHRDPTNPRYFINSGQIDDGIPS